MVVGSGLRLQAVSIHAPVKGATLIAAKVWRGTLSFNPRTREGCDYTLLLVGEQLLAVSIHAPMKGATHITRYRIPRAEVSIHAPVKGATKANMDVLGKEKSFNPRTREGCDL